MSRCVVGDSVALGTHGSGSGLVPHQRWHSLPTVVGCAAKGKLCVSRISSTMWRVEATSPS